MVELVDILAPERISLDFTASSKKTLLEKAAELLSTDSDSAHARDIFDSLCQRERLGSTGLGHGVAIPHGRVEGQDSVAGALVRLGTPIHFDAPDNEPVELFFALAVPARCTDVHLRLLAGIAERFGNDDCRRRLRAAASADAIMKIISEAPPGTEPG
ncbi:MAG: PTS IIA-like nitrogen regulatory protein PtsN [Wenzhouxiangella sp.]